MEPSILGTLFERGLDPDKRGQLGAHYTDTEKILMVVEPVVMQPLRREFEAMRARVEELAAGRTPSILTLQGTRRANLPPWERDAEATWRTFLDRLRAVRVLDPACGSGNFLYVTLRLLKDLEEEVLNYGSERLRLPRDFPHIDPHNVMGIELNPYAKELASVSIWVGHIQWMIDHGYGFPRNPVLQPLHSIEQRDAILAHEADGKPVPAEWPEAEFVVGNPPFLGDRMMRGGLGDEYVDELRAVYDGRLPGGSDLVCYWHELARDQIARGRARRAGLLATNSIRGGLNRRVLERIKETGDIFMAWADEEWVVEGANVRVSIIGQSGPGETSRFLDGREVAVIYPDLMGGAATTADLTRARSLSENGGYAFIGTVKAGPFDLPGALAREMLKTSGNPNGRPNSDVVVPWRNGLDIARRARDMFIIDFGERTLSDAAQYQTPFEYVREHVHPHREGRKLDQAAWWLHQRRRPAMVAAIQPLSRFLVTPSLAKYRLFMWMQRPTNPDYQLVVIARDDDYAFGVLHSRAHERWSLRMGTSLEDRPRYTPTSTFETFPFPWPLNTPDAALTPAQAAHGQAIGAAANSLDEARQRWLNPSELAREEDDILPSLPKRLVPVDEDAAKELAKRTLTNLYNQRPQWLLNAHRALDVAVFGAYGWPEAPEELDDETMLARLLALNLERAASQGT